MKKSMILAASLMMLAGAGFAAPYSDVPADHWACKAVDEMAQKGVIQGFPNGTFKGNDNISRYQLAMITSRLLAGVEQNGTGSISKNDLQTLERLTVEFADELALLGVKVTSLEEDLVTVKEDVASLKNDVSSLKENGGLGKVRLSGDMMVSHYYYKMNNAGSDVREKTVLRLVIDSDISEKVSMHARWNVLDRNNFINHWDGRNKNTSDVDIAYLKIKDAFTSGGELKLGRDWFNHGHNLVINSCMDAISYSKLCGDIDLTLNCFFDKINDYDYKNDFYNIVNINADYNYKSHKLYAGLYMNKRTEKINGTDRKNCDDLRIEFGSSGNLSNNNDKLSYDLGIVYSDTENTGAIEDAATGKRRDERGWLYHAALNYDSHKEITAKLAYTMADDGSNANIYNNNGRFIATCRDDMTRWENGSETIFEDLAWYNCWTNNGMNFKNLSDLKIQVGYTPKNAQKHNFRLAYDKVRSDKDNINFFGLFRSNMWQKVDFGMFTFEYIYRLGENTRLRMVYSSVDENSLNHAGNEVENQSYFTTEIYTRF